MMIKILPFLLIFLQGIAHAGDPHKENAWSRIRQPTPDTPQAIGSYANGCQLGANTLEESNTGFISIRRWRNRFYSQPVTLALIHHLGRVLARDYQAQILIGDLSLPAGGPMPFGHTSHQNGLDVDVWFYTVPVGTRPAANIEPPTVVDKATGRLIAGRWKQAYRDALYTAASYPQTNRIFVNPVIKQALCTDETDTRWLHKIRPWFGHDAHFHIRLNCPADNPVCVSQAAIAPGDGCNQALRKWVKDQSDAVLHPKPIKPAKPHKAKVLPSICLHLLRQS